MLNSEDIIKKTLSINSLFSIIQAGRTATVAFDIYNDLGMLVVQRGEKLSDTKQLQDIRNKGVTQLAIDFGKKKFGHPAKPSKEQPGYLSKGPVLDVDFRLREILEQKREACKKYNHAKKNIKNIVSEIKRTGGIFNYELLEDTVSDLLNFMTDNENAFSYLTGEIFSYDDYLYNHSINVCTLGTAVLRWFNFRNGYRDDDTIADSELNANDGPSGKVQFKRYRKEALFNISVGYFLHDIGKTLIPANILNKPDRLTNTEFDIVKTHSYKKGAEILKMNGLGNAYINNVVQYHHCEMYTGEDRCYPENKKFDENSAYIKIAKLVDIYDALTSRRCYKGAVNPINVATSIYRIYAGKDQKLQYILYSFLRVLGIYPAGSIARMVNGQLIYVLDSEGPLVIPFTDRIGNPLHRQHDPINLADAAMEDPEVALDTTRPGPSLVTSFKLLPEDLKRTFLND
ncbi:MAG: HD domain-containing protein [Desulfobacterales bacterium]|nr:HD domain-containing protein [Desulfobacterales bacterium]